MVVFLQCDRTAPGSGEWDQVKPGWSPVLRLFYNLNSIWDLNMTRGPQVNPERWELCDDGDVADRTVSTWVNRKADTCETLHDRFLMQKATHNWTDKERSSASFTRKHPSACCTCDYWITCCHISRTLVRRGAGFTNYRLYRAGCVLPDE